MLAPLINSGACVCLYICMYCTVRLCACVSVRTWVCKSADVCKSKQLHLSITAPMAGGISLAIEMNRSRFPSASSMAAASDRIVHWKLVPSLYANVFCVISRRRVRIRAADEQAQEKHINYGMDVCLLYLQSIAVNDSFQLIWTAPIWCRSIVNQPARCTSHVLFNYL